MKMLVKVLLLINTLIPRIAKIRNLSEKDLELVVQKLTEKPLLGLFGTEKINVLKLNLAVDNL